MTKIISKLFDNEAKCRGCNWDTKTLYSFEGEQGEKWENGLCGNCFSDMLEQGNYQITKGDYQKAYDILMEYWDCLPDERKAEMDKRLQECGV